MIFALVTQFHVYLQCLGVCFLAQCESASRRFQPGKGPSIGPSPWLRNFGGFWRVAGGVGPRYYWVSNYWLDYQSMVTPTARALPAAPTTAWMKISLIYAWNKCFSECKHGFLLYEFNEIGEKAFNFYY